MQGIDGCEERVVIISSKDSGEKTEVLAKTVLKLIHEHVFEEEYREYPKPFTTRLLVSGSQVHFKKNVPLCMASIAWMWEVDLGDKKK